jgi:carbonic anhydrase/acetyltransferase-like protein (isoleucine patch superfamily)
MSDAIGQVKVGSGTYVAPTSYVGGDVVVGDRCTVMNHVTIRGDLARITIGNRVNVQDGAIIHANTGEAMTIGDDVAIGHRAVVHGLGVESRALIGIGALILDGCVIGSESIVAAGAVLPPGTEVPARTLVMGVPGRPVRPVTNDELANLDRVVKSYVELGARYRRGEFPNAAGS